MKQCVAIAKFVACMLAVNSTAPHLSCLFHESTFRNCRVLGSKLNGIKYIMRFERASGRVDEVRSRRRGKVEACDRVACFLNRKVRALVQLPCLAHTNVRPCTAWQQRKHHDNAEAQNGMLCKRFCAAFKRVFTRVLVSNIAPDGWVFAGFISGVDGVAFYCKFCYLHGFSFAQMPFDFEVTEIEEDVWAK